MRFNPIAFLFVSLLASPMALWSDGPAEVVWAGLHFDSRLEFARSDFFRENGLRCATPSREERLRLYPDTGEGAPTDCSATSTNPIPGYDPVESWRIPVVVHILMDNSCTQGVISDALVESQIDILNEDFQALAGSLGALGTDVKLEFFLADMDPQGDPTNGITRNCNSTWFNDNGAYYDTLAWDPHNYMNIYTNTASGALGYVPFLPADGGGSFVGGSDDRVVILWDAFGRDAPGGPPYDQGRTATHEVGHYLGMEHTFNGSSCEANMPGCYSEGDLICDTEPEQSPRGGCPGSATSCSTPDPIHNYMDYTDDTCMEEFTLEQTRRIRCSLLNYRFDLYEIGAGESIFADGFESGDLGPWGI